MKRIMATNALVAGVVCGSMMLAGCSSSDPEPAAAPKPSKPAVTADPGAPLGSAAAVSLAEAEGLTGKGSVPRSAAGVAHSLVAVADDGALVMYVSKADTAPVDDGVRYASGRLEVVRPAGKAVRIPGSAREVDNVAAGRRHVVWAEAVRSKNAHVHPFRVMAYDRQAKAVRQLAYLPASSARTAPAVSIAGGRAFWTVRGIAGGVTEVFSRAVSGEGRIIRHLRTPGIVDAGADGVFLAVTGTGAKARQFRILQLDPSSGATHVVHTGRLAKDERLVALSAAGGALAWSTHVDGAGQATVSRLRLREADGKVVRFADALDAAGAELTGRFLTFRGGSEDGEAWLYDRSRGELVALGAAPGREVVMGAGDHVAWADGDVWRYAEVTPAAK